MAQKTSPQLKQNLLILFVVVCAVIIGATWVQNISGPQEKTPANYRGVPQAVGPTTAVTLAPDRAGGEGEHMHGDGQQSLPTESSPAESWPTEPSSTESGTPAASTLTTYGEAVQDDSTATPEP